LQTKPDSEASGETAESSGLAATYGYYSESPGIEGSEHMPIASEELITEEEVMEELVPEEEAAPVCAFVTTAVRENASIAPTPKPRDGTVLAARAPETQANLLGWAAPRAGDPARGGPGAGRVSGFARTQGFAIPFTERWVPR
jgi:hypothetical protein